MDMLYQYMKAFSLRDEIGTCPNIEVEIDIMDKSPFFIRRYHIKEEDKTLIDKEMKLFMPFRNTKGRIFSLLYPSHVNWWEGNSREEGSNRFQAPKC